MNKFRHFKVGVMLAVLFLSLINTPLGAVNVDLSKLEYARSVSLSLSNDTMTLEDLFITIEKSSEFIFIYNSKIVDISTKVEIEGATNISVESLLSEVLPGVGYTYLINNRQITVTQKSPAVEAKEPVAAVSNKNITGKVTDAYGKPMIGVLVQVKGTTRGSISGTNGDYTIEAKKGDTLVFSFMGYKDLEQLVNSAIVTVSLKENAIIADEVVVVGYGSMRKKDLTGSISTVTGQSIADRNNTSITSSLQGAVSGVTVTRSSSSPGATTSILVRGVTSISDSSPLIIVDGVPTDNIDHISPNDIESLTVLKDAASASIYGSRAAAGVIVVTTKRAKGESISLRYAYEIGFDAPTQQFDVQNSTEYMQSLNELRWNDLGNKEDGKYPAYSKETIDNYDQLMFDEPNKYFNTNWNDLILKKIAPRQSHTVSISGGSKFVKSNASINYDKTEGLLENMNYDKITIRTNNDFTINKYIGATLDMNYKRSMNDNPSYNPLSQSSIAAPVYGAMFSDGRVAEGKSGNNPWASHKYGGVKASEYNRLAGKAALNITPVKGLKVSVVLAPSFSFNKSKDFALQVPYFGEDNTTVSQGFTQDRATTKLSETRDEVMDLTTQVFANYDKTFGGVHNISAMAGYENYYLKSESLGASRDQYLLQNYPYLNLGPESFRDNSGSAFEQAYRSGFGRVSYNYDHRYLMQVNLRYDASSRFHQDYRWGAFPSVSLGWVASEESFLKGVEQISYLKFRASYGSLGNERIGNYPYQATMAFGNELFYQGTDIVSGQTAYQLRYAIQNISWETTESYNIAVDMNLFDNRLRFSGEYYTKVTSDMLLALEIPDYVGFENPNQNTGVMTTKGYDLDLAWSDIVGDFNYSVSVNLSNFESVMGDLGGTEFLGDKVKMQGSEFNEWYGYQTDGMFQSVEEVEASPLLGKNTKPGDIKFKDISGPDGVPDGIISPEYDRTLLGSSLPKYLYGASINLGWKGIDFGLVLQGVGKRDVSSASMYAYNNSNWGRFPVEVVGNQWSHYNTAEQNINAQFPRLTENNKANNYKMSDFWMFDGSYCRLKNITLGYTLPKSFTSKMSINNLRVYVSVNDILSIDNYPKGFDPEADWRGYPLATTVLGGVSISF